MKSNINVTVKGDITEKILENYYRQLWITLKEQNGEEILQELYKKLCKESH